MKKLNLKKLEIKINKINEYKLDNKSINIINIDYEQSLLLRKFQKI